MKQENVETIWDKISWNFGIYPIWALGAFWWIPCFGLDGNLRKIQFGCYVQRLVQWCRSEWSLLLILNEEGRDLCSGSETGRSLSLFVGVVEARDVFSWSGSHIFMGVRIVVRMVLLGIVCCCPLEDLIGLDLPTRGMICSISIIRVSTASPQRWSLLPGQFIYLF